MMSPVEVLAPDDKVTGTAVCELPEGMTREEADRLIAEADARVAEEGT